MLTPTIEDIPDEFVYCYGHGHRYARITRSSCEVKTAPSERHTTPEISLSKRATTAELNAEPYSIPRRHRTRRT